MRQSMWAGLAALSCFAVLAVTAPVRALMIAPAPIPQRVALAQVVVVGKVTGFADKTVSAPAFPGATDKVEYQVATVEVKDALQGAKDMKEIKVGFIPPGAGGPVRPGGPIIRPGRGGVNLVVDQEYVLFLNPHADAPFYVVDGFAGAIAKKDNPNFDKDMDEVKRLAKLVADPMAALKGKNADDRTTTAEMLVARYRTPRPMSANACKISLLSSASTSSVFASPAPARFRR